MSRLHLWPAAILFLGLTGGRIDHARCDQACSFMGPHKWHWEGPSVDWLESFEGSDELPAGSDSVASCWECGLWTLEILQSWGSPLARDERLSFQRARCYEALGMNGEALGAYRRHLAAHPGGRTAPAARNAILRLLFEQRNYQAVSSLTQALPPEEQALLLPESRYFIGQTFYILGQDHPAEQHLAMIPPDAAVYPYATYTRAQVKYRRGDREQALALLDSLLDSPSGASMPRTLADRCRLTRSRIFFQMKRFQEAIAGFKTVGEDSVYLPDALVDLGWSYDAFGEPAKAVAYFLEAQQTPADPDTLVQAQMEAARIFSDKGVYSDASQLFHKVQVHLLLRISQYKRWGEDAEWMTLLADALLGLRPSGEVESALAGFSQDQMGFWREVQALLERERAASPRLKGLMELQQATASVRSSLLELAARKGVTPQGFAPSPMEEYFPPMDPRVSAAGSVAPRMLDVGFQLIDTENRLSHLGDLLGLVTPDESRRLQLDAFEFYSSLLQDILFPSQIREGIQSVLDQMQSRVRHLPYALEDRERVLRKILSTRRALQDTADTLSGWADRIERTSSKSESEVRVLLLRQWMAYARSLQELRSWRHRSPLLFMAGDTAAQEAVLSLELPIEAFEPRIGERIRTVQSRIGLMLEREMRRIHERRAGELQNLLSASQRLFAEALLIRQEEITKDLQSEGTDTDEDSF
ncbi:MAG: hypothetical protein AB1640_17250 [bacterium]